MLVFISSDRSHQLFGSLPTPGVYRMTSVQNAAARLVTSTRRRDRITSVLRQLASGPETSGMQDCMSCTPVARFNGADVPVCLNWTRQRAWSCTRAYLRSSSNRTLLVSRTHTSFGDRSFVAA